MTTRQIIPVSKADATPSSVYRNPLLENVSIAAFQDPAMYVARAVCATVPCTDEQVLYYEFDMDSISRDKMEHRAPGTQATIGAFGVSKKTVLCDQYGYKELLPEELIRSAGNAGNIDVVSAKSVAEVALINAEKRFGSAFWTTGKWNRDMTGAASADSTHYVYWSTSTSTPIDDILAERQQILLNGKRLPNTLVLGADVAVKLMTHSQIVGRLNAGQTPGGPAMASLEYLAKIFMVERVIIAQAVYNSAAHGATASNAYILDSKSALLCYVNPDPAVLAPSGAYRFAWQGISGNADGIRNWRYWDQPTRSFAVEIAVNDTYQMTGSKLGTFFTGIVQ